ncbi:MAG: amidohydrolase family protein [Planctomycetota bacterium]
MRAMTLPHRLAMAACCTASVAAAAVAGPIHIETTSIVQRDGSLAEDASVTLRGGRIAAIAEEAPGRAEVHLYPEGSVLSPGLIDLGSTLGVGNEHRATAGPIDPDGSVIQAFDPYDDGLAEALEAGITSLMLTPAPNGVVRGRTATVSTLSGRDPLVTEGAHLLVVGEPATDTLYGPTSRAGGLFELRTALGDAAAGRSDSVAITELVAGEREAVVVAPEADDAALALQTLFGTRMFGFTVLTLNGTLEFSMNLREYGVGNGDVGFVTGPYSLDDAPDHLAGAGGLERAGVSVALRGGTGTSPASALRTTAALATRYGMTQNAARRAITVEPARIAGVADRLGSIEEGKTADLVVFSADPLRLDARVLAVYIDGELVFGGPGEHSVTASTAQNGGSR